MRPTSRRWLDGLRETVAEARAARPLPDLSAPSAALAAERMILAARLTTWLAGIDALAAARRARTDATADPDVVIVLSTSPVGIVAAADLLDPRGGPFAGLGSRIEPVTELEYRRWCMRAPDEACVAHVILWNWLKTRVPEQRHAEFARHPLGPHEAYWLHRTGVTGAGDADRRESHLWKWNGRHASLLEPFVTEVITGRAKRDNR